MRKILLIGILVVSSCSLGIPHYYATSADANFFNKLITLIETIQKNDQPNFAEIAVFDLGFKPWQREYLVNLEQVRVCDLEMVHPDLLKYFQTSPGGRKVRGWFAWKPVAIKQALDLYPYVLYLDAAMEIYRPLDDLFQHIVQAGYWLVDCGEPKENSLPYRITKPVVTQVVQKLSPAWQAQLLHPDTRMVSAGIQGLSRQVYDSYVLPVYQQAANLELFADDGSSKMGFGGARHDQALFSIYANLNGFKIDREGWQILQTGEQVVPFHKHWNRKELNEFSALKY